MTLRPEQVKAKEYLHAKGTRLTAPQIHERVTAGFAALEALLDGVTEAEARTRHRPSLEELRDLLAGRRPPGEPIPAGLQSNDPMARPWPELVDELKRIQALVVATLESAPDTLTTRARRSSWSSTSKTRTGATLRCTGSKSSTGKPTR